MLEVGRNQPKNAHKFQEITEKGDEDEISELPDCLLLEILSRLPSTKYAIRTGTLSKRWEHLWTLVPTLSFSLKDYPQHLCFKNPEFALLVDKSLTQCRQLKLKKFLVYTKYDIRFESQFNNWILFAISCNVEKLNVHFEYLGWEANFRLDQSVFFINSCFTDLSLRGCILNPSGAISWKNLRSLCIWTQKLDEDLIVNILSGCPLLETLVLNYDYFHSDYISSDSDDEIEAPNSLEQQHYPNHNSLSLLNQWPQLKKLKKLELHSHDIRFESLFNRWVRYAIRCNVIEINIIFYHSEKFKIDQILFISSCFNELLLMGCRVDPVGAISWKNLTSLHILYGFIDEVLIENILSGSPVLETLQLTFCSGYRRLNITSKSVKNLVLAGNEKNYDNYDIEINAPYILSLTIDRHFTMRNVVFLNVSSLVKATLDFWASPPFSYVRKGMTKDIVPDMLKEVILNLHHVKEVKIGFSLTTTLSSLQAEGFIVPSNVKFPQVT